MKYFLCITILVLGLSAKAQEYTVSNIYQSTLTINSRTSYNGTTRSYGEVVLPPNTKLLIYKITATPRGRMMETQALYTSIQLAGNIQNFLSQTAQNASPKIASSTPLDFFILNSAEDARNFYNKLDNWRYCKFFPQQVSTTSYMSECLTDKVYFCFRNNSLSDGADVHLEVVAAIEK